MRYPAYPKYKDSGVEWLGAVPEGWEVKRLRRILSESLQYGANVSAEIDDPDLPRYVRITDVHENGTLREETFRSLPVDIAAPYLLRDGDLLFARSGATAGKTFLYQKTWGLCAYAGYLIRARMSPKKAIPAFIKYFTASVSYWQWLSSIYIQSTIQNVSAEKYADLPLPLPSLSEQTVIADFLDRETGRIDTLVGKKQRLIELLKEKRTALISRIVTRGLPGEVAREFGLTPHTRFKDSGIEWLGEVPEGWEVKQLKWAVMFQRGHDLPADQREDGLIPVVSSAGVSASHNVAMAKGPGIVTGRYGTIGTFHLIKQDYWPLNTTLYSIELRGNNPDYLRYMLDHLSPLVILHSVKSAVPGVDRNDLHPTMISLPPRPEQTAIAAYLDRETAKIDKLIAKVEAAIARLREYRTALITAAVTGKIDVRGTVDRVDRMDKVDGMDRVDGVDTKRRGAFHG